MSWIVNSWKKRKAKHQLGLLVEAAKEGRLSTQLALFSAKSPSTVKGQAALVGQMIIHKARRLVHKGLRRELSPLLEVWTDLLPFVPVSDLVGSYEPTVRLVIDVLNTPFDETVLWKGALKVLSVLYLQGSAPVSEDQRDLFHILIRTSSPHNNGAEEVDKVRTCVFRALRALLRNTADIPSLLSGMDTKKVLRNALQAVQEPGWAPLRHEARTFLLALTRATGHDAHRMEFVLDEMNQNLLYAVERQRRQKLDQLRGTTGLSFSNLTNGRDSNLIGDAVRTQDAATQVDVSLTERRTFPFSPHRESIATSLETTEQGLLSLGEGTLNMYARSTTENTERIPGLRKEQSSWTEESKTAPDEERQKLRIVEGHNFGSHTEALQRERCPVVHGLLETWSEGYFPDRDSMTKKHVLKSRTTQEDARTTFLLQSLKKIFCLCCGHSQTEDSAPVGIERIKRNSLVEDLSDRNTLNIPEELPRKSTSTSVPLSSQVARSLSVAENLANGCKVVSIIPRGSYKIQKIDLRTMGENRKQLRKFSL